MTERLSHFLFVRPDKAGDAIKSLPALRALKAKGPKGQYHILATPHNASLFAFESGFIVHTLPKDWETQTPAELKNTIAKINLENSFDKIVSLPCDAFASHASLLSVLNSEHKFSTATNSLSLPKASPAHRDESLNIALLLDAVFDCGVANSLTEVSLAPGLSQADHLEAQNQMGEKLGKWLGFCPFAGLQNRTHPLTTWKKFIRRATSEKAYSRFFLFGAWSDKGKLEELRNASAHPEKISLCFPSTFRTLGAYLSRLDAVVAVDSGPLHFARSLGIPSLGVLSGGDADRWFPPRAKAHILKRGLFQRYPSAFEMLFAFRRFQATR